VRRVWIKGSRKDFYEAEVDISKVIIDRFKSMLQARLSEADNMINSSYKALDTVEFSNEKEKQDADIFRQRIDKLKFLYDKARSLFDLLNTGSLNNILTKKKSELAGIQSQLVQFREEAMAEKTRLNEELEAAMKRFGVKEQEVKEATKLKSELAKRGLNISTLIKVVEEFPDDSN